MKKFSIKSWFEKIQLVAIRFPFTLFFIVGLAFLFFVNINKDHADIQPHTWVFFSLGILLTIPVTLLLEESEKVILRVGANVLGLILLLSYCYFLPAKLLQVHSYQVFSIGIALTLSAFVVSYFKKNNDIAFWEFGKNNIIQFFFSFIFSQVMMLGLSLAVLSLKELFKVDVHHEVYENLAVICYALFAPVYFLANVPDKTEKRLQTYTFNTFLKILGLYILLPILAIYTFILYVYFLQIIIKWELPNGWVSTLVSVLGLGGFICMLILYPLRLENANKLVSFFSRFFSVILFPLLLLMSVGIFRRLGDYGLTINRLYVLILNMWLVGISIYLFLSKANHLKWIIISFAAVLLVSSVGPWSVFSLTKRSLQKEIPQLMASAHLLKNGKAIDNSKGVVKLDSLTAEKLGGKLTYVFQTYGAESIQPLFKDSIKNAWELKQQLGIEREYLNSENQYFNASLPASKAPTSIAEYRLYLRIQRENDTDKVYNGADLIVKYKNNALLLFKPAEKTPYRVIPLQAKLKQLQARSKKSEQCQDAEFTMVGTDYMLVITNVVGFTKFHSGSITVTNMQADLFLK